MSDLNLDEIEARVAACFIGPWTAETWSVECPGHEEGEDGDCGYDHDVETIISPDYPGEQVVAQIDHETGAISTPGLGCFAAPHAAFIAAARTDVPALCAYVRELERERDATKRAIDRFRDSLAKLDALKGRFAMTADEERKHCEGAARECPVPATRDQLWQIADLIQRERAAAISERDAMRQRLLPEDERHVLNDRDACIHCGQLCIVGERCPARTECFRRAVADAREQALEQALFDAEVELKRLASIAWDAGQGLAEDGDDDAAECEEERAMGIESGINAIRALKSSERP